MVYFSSTKHSKEDCGLGDLEAQLASNEQEQRELLAARVRQLESHLKKSQEECFCLRERYQKLREDFQFNLALLDERDRELERYDVNTARALTVDHNRQREINQLHMQVAKLQEERAREAEERRKDAVQHKLQLDKLKCSVDGEIQKEREEYEKMKLKLQCRIQEVEGQQALQRQEMTAAFDSELRQREHELNLKIDEMHAIVLSRDLKVKLLSKETEVHCQAQHKATEALKTSKDICQEIQSQLQHKDQEIKNLISVKDCKIKKLEDKLKWMKTKFKKEEDDYIKKYKDLVLALKECNAYLEAQYQAPSEKLQIAEKHIFKLQGSVECLAAKLCSIQEDQQKAMGQKEETIQRLRTEVEAAKTGWTKYISQVSSEMVVKDTEIVTLQERETKLRTEWEKSREETERYKQQLSAGLKREKALEQMQVQIQLELQKCCEDTKAQQYLANEQLIQDLTQARDQAKAELKEREQDLKDLTVLLRSVTTERDQALQGPTPKVNSLESEKISCLQQQNSILRAVVTQMKNDMEGLIHFLPDTRAQPQASAPQPVQYPERLAATSINPRANTLTAIGPQAQGGQCLEKHANSSALVKEEVKVATRKPAFTNLMAQRAPVQQLQEDNLYLQQRQASRLDSGGLHENLKNAKSNPPLLYARLKQAASCIARLSIEKLQLIEMNNRLRAQIPSVGLQEPVEQERDLYTEKQGDQHDRLLALELLQHQLTTQELQYALRQRTSTFAEDLPTERDGQGPATDEAGKPLSQECRSGMSSESLTSLNELWKILDHGFSPTVLSEGEGELSRRSMAESVGTGVQIMVNGVSAPINSKPQTEMHQRRIPSKPSSKTTKTAGRTCKVRNYNVKD